ncbi:MAG: PIN domain-containing protein [Microthrixaceae bacterium]
MGGLVAVLDADVLVPILVCDLLLTAFDHDLYQPVVTPKILDEVERNLIRAHPALSADRLRARVDDMRVALRRHTLADSEAGTAVAGVNAKDRHVVAAALVSGARVVVTNDRRLQREIAELGSSVRAVSADEFAVTLNDADTQGMRAVVDTLVAKRVRRFITREELLDRLANALPELVARQREQPRC